MKIFLISLLILFLFLLAILIWILLAQVIITIDSRKQLYEFRINSIGWARLNWEEQFPTIDIRILFWQGNLKFNPFSSREKKESTIKKEKPKRKQSRSWKEIKGRAIRVFRSFRLETMRLNLDTDSYYHNSLLYPVFFLSNTQNIKLNINYQGISELLLIVKNRPIRVLYALFF